MKTDRDTWEPCATWFLSGNGSGAAANHQTMVEEPNMRTDRDTWEPCATWCLSGNGSGAAANHQPMDADTDAGATVTCPTMRVNGSTEVTQSRRTTNATTDPDGHVCQGTDGSYHGRSRGPYTSSSPLGGGVWQYLFPDEKQFKHDDVMRQTVAAGTCGAMPKDTDGDPSSVACGINVRKLEDIDGDRSSVASGSGAGMEAMNKVLSQEVTGEKMHTSGACSSDMVAAGTGIKKRATRGTEVLGPKPLASP